MADRKQFRLPDVGEGLTEAEIVSWKVQPGDAVKVNDPIVEIETAKSLVELPSPYAGVVSELLVGEGETVDVGTPIISVDTGAGAAGTGGGREDLVPSPADQVAAEPGLIGGPAPGGRTSVLVGYGPRTTEAKRRPRKGSVVPDEPAAAMAHQALETVVGELTPPRSLLRAEQAPPAAAPAVAPPTQRDGGSPVLAKPPVRKLAKSLGVDLAGVAPTGPGGVVTRADVEAAAGPSVAAPTPVRALPGTRETRVPVRGVRKMTAQAMVASAFTAPHVTEWITVDVTRSVELVERLKARPELADARVGPLVLVMKALLVAVARHPGINAAWDEAAQEIVVKHYVNLGIAAATPRGLIVPNIKDAQDLSLSQLAGALAELVTTAREGRTPPQDMQGGTITITNVGVYGVDAGTPILNPGEAAILAFGAVRDLPWVVDGQVVARKVTQLALSFDHRLVDGELGSRFLADLAAILEDPDLLHIWAR